ncbi:MAG: ankyrin repeat domain-containing protein [Pseudomonadota bacterium]
MPKSIDQLRRDAKALGRAYAALDPNALARVRNFPPRPEGTPLKHSDFLHVVAREQNFPSWPQLAWAAETVGLDRAGKQQRLKIALYHGQFWVIERLLADTPDLADGVFDLEVALYRRAAVEDALGEDPTLATRTFGLRRPILALAFSKYLQARPELEGDMLAIAAALVANGADVNDCFPYEEMGTHMLPALYGALGHANNMPLARWLLDHGADPNDGESLYHATELDHLDGLRMLLAAGADPTGTNALYRAMDFDNVAAVRLLLEAGAASEDYNAAAFAGEPPAAYPCLHQAARRGSSRDMVDVLIAAGADTSRVHGGVSSYALARAWGNAAVADAIAAAGGDTTLDGAVADFVAVADGTAPPGTLIDPAKLPGELRDFAASAVTPEAALARTQRLIAAGLEYDRADYQGLTPVQAAGWQGLPEAVAYFLSLKPDLGHINGYGGTLLTTIIHGSENCPERATRDHIACLELALREGMALPKRAVEMAGEAEVAAFLADWAEAHPGQVAEHGVG